MPEANPSFATCHVRMEAEHFVGAEVNVRNEYANHVRAVASAPCDPARHADAGRLIRQRFGKPADVNLKVLLASAPLDGIDLDCGSDLGREWHPQA